jgi:hypothetical protein
MLVSSIISNAMSKADIANQNFYTSNDQLFDAQLAWEEIYTLLTENDDDYFVTSVYITPSVSFTSDSNRTSIYLYPLPADFYRLRMISYKGLTGGYYIPCSKMDVMNFGYTQSTPAYRIVGQNIEIYDPYSYTSYNFWYYPAPAALTTATNIIYPNTALLEYMVWKIAADIRRKQNQDPIIQQMRANEIMETMKRQIHRDDFRAQKPKDIFSSGNDYWS